jgi:hypothetical protein
MRTFDGDFDVVNNRSLTIAEVQQVLAIATRAEEHVKSDTSVYLYDAKVTVCAMDSMSPIAAIWWNAEAELWCIDFGAEEK